MKFGVLSDRFEGAGAKYLTEVEINPEKSNQHEFQGVGGLRRILGETGEKTTFPTTFLWVPDSEETGLVRAEGFCTWSDVRRANPNRSAEYHLYYSAESEHVVHSARAGDIAIFARTKEDALFVVLCAAESTVSRQLLWLFGLNLDEGQLSLKILEPDDSPRLGYSVRSILDMLELEIHEPEPDVFERLVHQFGLEFPTTLKFSEFARETAGEVDPVGDPDGTLVKWMDHEEMLFRHMERQLVAKRISEGFVDSTGVDVDGFVSFSLQVQNRRKSRAGSALGHHLETVIQAHGIRYIREATTEKRNGPDFLFPGETEYHSEQYDASRLTMLAAKTSCKDRWRQVLAEADQIANKHLLTLQPGISLCQTEEMEKENLQLVVPDDIRGSYTSAQRKWLINLKEFLRLVSDRE